MLLKPCFLALALTLAAPAFAQPGPSAPRALPAPSLQGEDCKAQEALLERDMDLARSRGQMLRRRELADALGTLQAQCKLPAVAQGREARIERLEQDIRMLRSELEQAEAQLRTLRAEPR
ncbi:Protein of unknown function [Variovorax sp. OK605]|jgi:multidrug resistance efflux pump|uniref:DUF1090 family protein n=1 Tax=unclassified Variovorax TaxID=663243 RepID=UPI0008C91E0F|nr:MULTISPECIES: DUF1090 family protein [unclassified Variovorax]SEK05774.1 Protein of unknown function [Variovorax sp. OK202]SFD44104.1 Protein of unknown function [Variovorax sp. OK212]SFQ39579.1 Protein of unknown function [Variovorax sp. OK605]